MKKLLMATIVLFAFAISLMLVQISCSKSDANPLSPQTQVNKIVYQYYNSSQQGIYLANYDGTDQHRLNITLPTGYSFANIHEPKLSPDASKVFFASYDAINNLNSIFSCDTSGANLIRIVDTNVPDIRFGGAY